MSILAFERHKKLAVHGEAIGRKGMSDLVAKAVADWQRDGAGPKGAMILAGRLKAITQMATRDDYWKEQVDKGFNAEYRAMLEAEIKRRQAHTLTTPPMTPAD